MRKAQENPKAKQKLLDGALKLMLTKGFVATSVEEICQKAKLTKGSFFHYFKSKDDLAKTLLERFCCQSQQKFKESCCSGKEVQDPLDRIDAYIDCVVQMTKGPQMNPGCLIGTFAQELSDTHPEIRSMCAQGFGQWAKIIQEDLKEAKLKYAPSGNVNVKELADYFISVVEGSQILAKAQKNGNVIIKNMEILRRYIRGLFKRA